MTNVITYIRSEIEHILGDPIKSYNVNNNNNGEDITYENLEKILSTNNTETFKTLNVPNLSSLHNSSPLNDEDNDVKKKLATFLIIYNDNFDFDPNNT